MWDAWNCQNTPPQRQIWANGYDCVTGWRS